MLLYFPLAIPCSVFLNAQSKKECKILTKVLFTFNFHWTFFWLRYLNDNVTESHDVVSFSKDSHLKHQ